MDSALVQKHLRPLFAGRPEAWVEFRALREGRLPGRFFGRRGPEGHGNGERPPPWDAWLARAEREGYNLYVGAQPRLRPGGATRDVLGYGCVVVDLDPKHAEGAKNPRCALARVGAPPSLVVRSGRPGARHLYWLLDNVYTVETARVLAERLVKFVGGDSVFDPPRIMRLAGTVNTRTGAVADFAVYRAERRYGPRALWEALDRLGVPVPEPRAARVTTGRVIELPPVPGGIPPALPQRVGRRLRVAACVRSRETLQRLGYKSRSHRDFGIAAALARLGWSEERIVQFFCGTQLAVGDKTREGGERYAARTAAWAVRSACAWGFRYSVP